MFDSRAAQLQKQALEALSDLRVWIWGRHAALLPDDLAAITREEAERYAAYLDWYSRVEEVLLALGSAGTGSAGAGTTSEPALDVAALAPAQRWSAAPPAQPAALHEQLMAPTVRAPGSSSCAAGASGWQRMISLAAAEPFAAPAGYPPARGSAAA
jgi:hypothetical protein